MFPVHAGAANNVIPNEVQITGTIRSFDDETRDELWKGLEAAMEVARALGGDYRLKFERGYPAMYNAAEVSDVIRGVTTDVFGDDGLIEHEVGMGAEDFSYMLQAAPGAMFNLGAKYDDKDRPHHSPVFNIAEDMLPVGVTVLASAALRLLAGRKGSLARSRIDVTNGNRPRRRVRYADQSAAGFLDRCARLAPRYGEALRTFRGLGGVWCISDFDAPSPPHALRLQTR